MSSHHAASTIGSILLACVASITLSACDGFANRNGGAALNGSTSDDNSAGGPAQPGAAALAFPGAEGFGAMTPGGRGGMVLEVTNLNDSGAGSLRAAVMASGPRIVVFRVAGTIEHGSPLKIKNPFLTIAGQSAPGGGITLSGEEVRIQTHDVVIRHLRIRTGDRVRPVDGWNNRDALTFGDPGDPGGTHDVVIDHCSLSWSVDEILSTWYETHDVTVQHCILSEALLNNRHPEGAHSMGVLIGDGSSNISLHHNLLAHCNGRNPQVAGAGVVDLRNNVIYNWGEYAALFKLPDNRINLVGNLWRPGPDAGASWSPNAVKLHTDAVGLRLFIDQNVDPICRTGDEDNWAMLVWPDGSPVGDRSLRVAAEHPHPPILTQDAMTASAGVLASAGATRPSRDAIDARVVADVEQGTGFIIDSPQDVGGWVAIAAATPPVDVDKDGMPDSWETSHGLDPSTATDGPQDRDGDGYSNVEEYLNALAAGS